MSTTTPSGHMTPKQRLLTALDRGVPDHLPATTHHVMGYYLDRYMDGISYDAFFERVGLDAIRWAVPHTHDPARGEYPDPDQGEVGFLASRRVATDDWRITREVLPDARYQTERFTITTPKGELTTVLQSNEHTTWVGEHLIKEKGDIDLIGEYATAPKCDVAALNAIADEYGERGLVRGHICCFDLFGQPGTWQDAACQVGIEKLIMATYDDPEWVHQLLDILMQRKLVFARSLAGARYDVLELGGGDASSTVISPKIFDRYVAPYDSQVIATAQAAGQRIAYHTCGGMMPLLEQIADMGPNAMETFTPPGMGGDTDLAEAKHRIGDRVCMIGGFDQFHFFTGCKPEDTRAAVRACFEQAGGGGGYIMCPSDHFFDADPKLVAAYADEARRCVYD